MTLDERPITANEFIVGYQPVNWRVRDTSWRLPNRGERPGFVDRPTRNMPGQTPI